MKEIKFVDVGEGITEGHIKKWLVADGAQVREDQSLLQVETDKAIVNVPSPIDGILKIVAKEDSVVKVGDMIAYVGAKEEVSGAQGQGAAPAAQAQPVQQQQQEVAKQEVPEVPKHLEVLTTPYVRKLARDLDVDLSNIKGTGPNGRILENDVRGHSAAAAPPKPVPKFSETLEEQHKNDIERIPLTMTRKAIAKNMEASLEIPSAVSMDLIDATALWDIVSKQKARASEMGVRLTFMPFIIKAVIAALKENPNFNASYDHETLEIIKKNYYNIGIAVESQDGLKVFVIKFADKKSIMSIAKEMQVLEGKVKDQSITIDEMRDSTFTISNAGSLGGGFLFIPIINHPDVAILGTAMIRQEPIVKDDMIKIGRILPVTLVFDHRVVDGAEAIKFGKTLKSYLENPVFLEMI